MLNGLTWAIFLFKAVSQNGYGKTSCLTLVSRNWYFCEIKQLAASFWFISLKLLSMFCTKVSQLKCFIGETAAIGFVFNSFLFVNCTSLYEVRICLRFESTSFISFYVVTKWLFEHLE